jgi:hypothetical protein
MLLLNDQKMVMTEKLKHAVAQFDCLMLFELLLKMMLLTMMIGTQPASFVMRMMMS